MSEVTREEKLLSAIATGENADFEPITRQEMYLAKMAGQSVDTPEPITRVEKLYEQIILNGGGGGGGDTPTQTKSLDVVENGSYTVTPDSGYALSEVDVSVAVPMPNVQMKQLTITENGVYSITPDAGYDLMGFVGLTVNVPIPEYETWQGGAY